MDADWIFFILSSLSDLFFLGESKLIIESGLPLISVLTFVILAVHLKDETIAIARSWLRLMLCICFIGHDSS